MIASAFESMASERLFNKGTELGSGRRGFPEPATNSTKGQGLGGARPHNVPSRRAEPDTKRANTAVRHLAIEVRALQKATNLKDRQTTSEHMQVRAAEILSALEGTRLGMVAVLAKALGKLFNALSRHGDPVHLSTLRTITRALDLISATLPKRGLDLPQDGVYRVLVVDDDLVCLRALSMALRVEQLKIEVCAKASAALGILEQRNFHVVFTDIMMPGVDGFGMVKQMRELPGHGGTPVVYVTALGDYQTRVTSVLSGGCDLIVKPFNPSEMVVKALTIGLQESVERWENDRRTTPVAPSTSSTDNPGDLVCRLEKRCATLETRLHELTVELKEVSSALKTAKLTSDTDRSPS